MTRKTKKNKAGLKANINNNKYQIIKKNNNHLIKSTIIT